MGIFKRYSKYDWRQTHSTNRDWPLVDFEILKVVRVVLMNIILEDHVCTDHAHTKVRLSNATGQRTIVCHYSIPPATPTTATLTSTSKTSDSNVQRFRDWLAVSALFARGMLQLKAYHQARTEVVGNLKLCLEMDTVLTACWSFKIYRTSRNKAISPSVLWRYGLDNIMLMTSHYRVTCWCARLLARSLAEAMTSHTSAIFVA